MLFQKSNGLVAAALLLSLTATASVFAQQNPDSAGVVRITDGRVRTAGQPAGGTGIQQTSGWRHQAGGMPCSDGSCQSGYGAGGNYVTGGYGIQGGCPTGNCPGYGDCRSGRCGRCRGCLHGLFCEQCCKKSPDYGYSPPSKIPLLRRGVEYSAYYPNQWYGTGGDYCQSSAPMVYQPTDTTQLGFYYQHVPFWQPRPNFVPDRPIPADWHVTPPAVQASNWGNGCYYGLGCRGCRSCRHGRHGYNGGYDIMDGCPVDGTMSTLSPTPVTSPSASGQPTPAEAMTPSSPGSLPAEGVEPGTEPTALPPTTALPPAPSLEGIPVKSQLPTTSATSGHIRRIGFAK